MLDWQDGWSDMQRIMLMDDREECKSAGVQKPGEIKLLLKSIQKLNATGVKGQKSVASVQVHQNKVFSTSSGSSPFESAIGGTPPLQRIRESDGVRQAWYQSESEPSQTSRELSSSLSVEENGQHEEDEVAAAVAARPELLVPYSELTIVKFELGQGSFGVVHRAKWRGMDVAVKCRRKTKAETVPPALEKLQASMMRRVSNHYAICGSWILKYPPGVSWTTLPGRVWWDCHCDRVLQRWQLEEMLYVSSLINRRHELLCGRVANGN